MAEMWYYTSEGKQKDPVPDGELKRLALDGVLKPTDMVWKDGLPRWIRASSVKELFADPSSALDQYFSGGQESRPAAAAPVGNASSGKSTAPPRTIDEDEPRRPSRRRRPHDEDRALRRRPAPQGGSSKGGIVLFLALGGFVLFGALVGGVVILIVNPRRPNPPQPMVVMQPPMVAPPIPALAEPNPNPNAVAFVNGVLTYETPPLGINAKDSRSIPLRKGITYEFTVRSNQAIALFNVLIIDRNDKRIATEKLKSDLRLQPAEDGDYRVEVVRKNEGLNAPATVTIRELKSLPGVGKENAPLPADVKTGDDSMKVQVALAPGQDHTLRFRVKAGHKASFTVTPFPIKKDTDFNLFVHKDSDNALIIANERPDASARVEFTVPADEIVRVRVHNASKTASAVHFTLQYDVGN